MDEDELSLAERFIQVKSHLEEIELLDPRSDEFKQNVYESIQSLEKCQSLANRLSLFSPNEEIDDVSTQNIQYLAVDYLLAELLLKVYHEDRRIQLTRAAQLLASFLAHLEEYGILSAPDKKLFDRYRDEKDHFALASSSNYEQRRNVKITRFREEKALKERLKVLRQQSLQNRVDDEVVRNLYISELGLYAHQTFQTLDIISQELTILRNRPAVEPSRSNGEEASQDRRQNSAADNGYSEKLDGTVRFSGSKRGTGPLLDPKGKPLQPFTLTDKRTQFRQGVFGPDHSLPTMSIDEYLEEERRRGGIIDGGGNANTVQPEPDEDNMDAVDEATMKARDWDEFVEANPKGAGNRLNRG